MPGATRLFTKRVGPCVRSRPATALARRALARAGVGLLCLSHSRRFANGAFFVFADPFVFQRRVSRGAGDRIEHHFHQTDNGGHLSRRESLSSCCACSRSFALELVLSPRPSTSRLGFFDSTGSSDCGSASVETSKGAANADKPLARRFSARRQRHQLQLGGLRQ